METREYRTVDKSGWGNGSWLSEPDKRQWQDEATGLPCLIVRGPLGALCGYVGVSTNHPAHGKNYDHWNYGEDARELTPVEVAINALKAHGGLTYADGCQHPESEDRGICHVPGDGEPDDVWWFGFDCGHYLDFIPGMARSFGPGTYRDLAYVTEQVAGLAAQLAAIATAKDTA